MDPLHQVIEKAFDYRGDVTVDLKDGSQIVGFLSNRQLHGTPSQPEPFIEMMIEGRDDLQRIECRAIAAIRMTGEDCAAGKSWADYVAKHSPTTQATIPG